ncbi:hypothetical protein L9F63_010168, partial [Diploptera punctata]
VVSFVYERMGKSTTVLGYARMRDSSKYLGSFANFSTTGLLTFERVTTNILVLISFKKCLYDLKIMFNILTHRLSIPIFNVMSES